MTEICGPQPENLSRLAGRDRTILGGMVIKMNTMEANLLNALRNMDINPENGGKSLISEENVFKMETFKSFVGKL